MSTNSASACRSTRVLALAAALLLSGCAGMTQTECRSSNWYELGERDGIAGLQPRIDQYAHQCSAWQVPVADSTYMTGWQHGKWEYDSRVHRSDCCPQ
jgi:hypothetical protein